MTALDRILELERQIADLQALLTHVKAAYHERGDAIDKLLHMRTPATVALAPSLRTH